MRGGSDSKESLTDGSRVYVAVADDNNVAIIDLKTFEVTGRFTTGIDPDGMAWTTLQ